jgi:hypothetical protein
MQEHSSGALPALEGEEKHSSLAFSAPTSVASGFLFQFFKN